MVVDYGCTMDGYGTTVCMSALLNHLAFLYCSTTSKGRQTDEFNAPIRFLVCWVLPAVLTAGPFVGLGRLVPRASGTFCCYNWDDRAGVGDTFYLIGLFVGLFGVPGLILLAHWMSSRADEKKEDEELKMADGQCLDVCPVVMAMMLLWSPYGCDIIFMLLGNPARPFFDKVGLMSGITSFAIVPAMIARGLGGT